MSEEKIYVQQLNQGTPTANDEFLFLQASTQDPTKKELLRGQLPGVGGYPTLAFPLYSTGTVDQNDIVFTFNLSDCPLFASAVTLNLTRLDLIVLGDASAIPNGETEYSSFTIRWSLAKSGSDARVYCTDVETSPVFFQSGVTPNPEAVQVTVNKASNNTVTVTLASGVLNTTDVTWYAYLNVYPMLTLAPVV